ncbi:hypothetical protein VPH35_069816 [Triticum aestivum]|nr:haloacid dehalogenase-like hydrolase domain-containing protein 3 [Triticum aestivum]
MPATLMRCPLLLGRHPVTALRHSSSSRMRRVRRATGGGSQGRPPAYGGLLLDAGGTLLQLAQPVAKTYAALGRPYGVRKPEKYIMEGFKRAFSAPWPKTLRYQGDGRPFWRIVVAEATDCTNNDYFEEVYQYYAHGDAWRLPDGAYRTLRDLKKPGVKLAVVSNFDTRLRKLLKDLNVSHMFDAIVVSSEVGYEKPAPEIFKIALDQIGVEARNAVHVGDDETADKAGANAIGLKCWLWGEDVKKFSEIQHQIVAKGSR